MELTPRGTRIGMIVPSSNTCLEPMTYRILEGRRDVTVHFSRIPVTRIQLDDQADRQFDLPGMQACAELLATAGVDVITWNGTAGSWLGIDAERALVSHIHRTTGIQASTSTLAYLNAFAAFDIHRVGLVTPYTADVNERVAATYAREGIKVIAERHFDLTDNESFARVPADRLRDAGRAVTEAEDVDAVIFLCTNLPAAPLAQDLERDTGVPVLDSVAITLWDCLRMAGTDRLLSERWGRLLTSGAVGATGTNPATAD